MEMTMTKTVDDDGDDADDEAGYLPTYAGPCNLNHHSSKLLHGLSECFRGWKFRAWTVPYLRNMCFVAIQCNTCVREWPTE